MTVDAVERFRSEVKALFDQGAKASPGTLDGVLYHYRLMVEDVLREAHIVDHDLVASIEARCDARGTVHFTLPDGMDPESMSVGRADADQALTQPALAPTDTAPMTVRWQVAGVELLGVLDPVCGWKWGTRRWSWPWTRAGEG